MSNKLSAAMTVLVLLSLIGCGDNKEVLDQNEELYQVGAKVRALEFDEAQAIELYLLKGTGENAAFEKVVPGEYVEVDPDEPYAVYKLGVKVTPRLADGVPMSQRIFLSNGGWDYQVEALYDEKIKLYVADFKFSPASYMLTHPVLVQAIYDADQMASKQQFIFHTQAEMGAKPGMLVDKGLNLSISQAALDALEPAINTLLKKNNIPGVQITKLRPASNGIKGIITATVNGIMTGNLILDDTTNALWGNNQRALAIGIEGPFGVMHLDGIMAMPLGFDLGELLNVFGGSDSGEEANPLMGLLAGLKLDSTLFLNIKGDPKSTNMDNAVIGGGIYVADSKSIPRDEENKPLWPEVTVDATDTKIDLNNLWSLKPDIGIALSQYNLNQVLPAIMQNMNMMTIADIGSLTSGLFAPKDPRNTLDLVLKVNPAGVAIDMATQRLVVNDVRATLVERGVPMSELVLDMTFNFGVNFSLNTITPWVKPDKNMCFLHVLRDGLNLDFLDKSTGATMIIETFTGGKSSIEIPIDLTGIGITPQNTLTPGQVMFDKNGNCFMSLSVASIDSEKLMGGCFISTAGYY